MRSSIPCFQGNEQPNMNNADNKPVTSSLSTRTVDPQYTQFLCNLLRFSFRIVFINNRIQWTQNFAFCSFSAKNVCFWDHTTTTNYRFPTIALRLRVPLSRLSQPISISVINESVCLLHGIINLRIALFGEIWPFLGSEYYHL